jgi:peptidoglycan/LPS O-acetylase OafA/YrhL
MNYVFYYCLIPAFIVLTWLGVPKTPFDNLYFYGYLTCIFLGLPVLFEKTKVIGWVNFLGNLSYPIYLSHTIVLSLLFLGPNPLIPQSATCSRGWQGQAIFLLSTITTGIFLHYFIENKLQRAVIKLLQKFRTRSL